MSAILPPYTGENGRCAKCGSTSARTRYQARLDPSARIQHELRNVPMHDPEQERLCRECERCHFHWDEAVAAPQSPEPMTEHVAQVMLDDFRHAMAANGFHVLGMTGGAVYVKAIVPRGSCSPAAGETVPNNQETP